MLNTLLTILSQELLLTITILGLLIIKLGKDKSNGFLLGLINISLVINIIWGILFSGSGNLFEGMFLTNNLIILEKSILTVAVLIISMQSHAWLKNHDHLIEFYVLILTSLLGMYFMISSGNLLLFYLGLEMSTIPLAAAANFDLTKRKSAESAFKLIISSAFSSALLLLGISFLYGISGTLSFSSISMALANQPLHMLSFLLFFSGFAFKISAVPFHLWTADVYEGAPVSVTSFLSVVSKSAVLFVFIPVLYRMFEPLEQTWYPLVIMLAVITIVVGNLFALRQENMKRFLAFSSIAQVGFVLIGLSGSIQMGAASVIYFLLVYVFSNLAAFGVISVVSAMTGKENMGDFKGFHSSNPLLAWVLAIALFSLAGVPPTAGFFGKFLLLLAGAEKGNYWLISIAGLNMVISFYYYLKVVKVMFVDKKEFPLERIQIPVLSKIALGICVGGVLLLGILGWFYDHIFALTGQL